MSVNRISVVDYLLPGQANAIPARQLADLMGIRSTRYLRILVETERRNGAVILSSTDDLHNGYYLPGCQDEVDRYIAQQQKRVKTTLDVIKSAKRFRKLHQPGQMYIADMARGKVGGNADG